MADRIEDKVLRFSLILPIITAYAVFLLAGGESSASAAIFFVFLGLVSFTLEPVMWVFLSLIILLFVPAEANLLFTGVSYLLPTGEINLHILTYFTMGGFLCWMLSSHEKKINKTPFLRKQAIVFLLMVAMEIIIELLNIRKEGGISNQLPDVYIGPILYYFVLVTVLDSEKKNANVRNIFLGILVIIAVFGVQEHFSMNNFYLSDLLESQNVSWNNFFMMELSRGQSYRIMTTLGHPLTNGAYFLAAFVIIFYSIKRVGRKGLLKPFLAFIFLTALILTMSRGAFVLAGISIIWSIVGFGSTKKFSRILIFSSIAFAGFFLLQPLIGLLLERDLLFSDVSASARFSTITALFQGLQNISILGYGTGNMEEAISVILGGFGNYSLEVGYIIVLLQYGLIFLLLYLYGIFVPIRERTTSLTSFQKAELAPYMVCVALIFIYFGGSNTIGVRSTINYLFFFVLALFSSKIMLLKSRRWDREILQSG
ncbi:O-antigen ligase family protein [Gemmatimonadota bacterium]